MLEDQEEYEDLYESRGEEARKLERALDEWLDRIVEQRGLPTQLDPAVLERLRSLGYIQ